MMMKQRSVRKEREFGLVVGGVFVLLSLWWFYRGKFHDLATITLTIGTLLVLIAILYPPALVLPNRVWMLLAEVLSFVSTRIILGVVFFVVLTPIGLIKRAMGWDPLARRAPPRDSYWRPYSERQRNPKHFEKMY